MDWWIGNFTAKDFPPTFQNTLFAVTEKLLHYAILASAVPDL
jgi:hypothetical protein